MSKFTGSIRLFSFVILIWISSLVFSGAFPAGAAEEGRLIQGIYVGTHKVGGFSSSQLLELLSRENQALQEMTLSYVLESGEESFQIPYSRLGIEIDSPRIWQESFQAGRTGNLWQRWRIRWQVRRQGLVIPIYVKIDRDIALVNLQEQTKHLAVSPQSARFMITPRDKVEILPEVVGRTPDLEGLLDNLEKELSARGLAGFRLSLGYRPVNPAVKAADLAGYRITGLVASFTTYYNPEKVGRSRNIMLAASSLEGFILAPGHVFSFNKVVGPRTRQRGYDEGDVILNNELVPDIGGGVCQVSTTLYNAVLLAELEIMERHRHSLLIRYVEPGLDATVAYGSKDFCFRNNRESHILIKSYAGKGAVTFKLFGLAEKEKRVVLKSIKEKEVPPQTIYRKDPLLPYGKYILEKDGSPGIYIRVERHTYNDSGQLVKKEIVSRDYYPPVNRVVRTGTDVSLLSIYPTL